MSDLQKIGGYVNLVPMVISLIKIAEVIFDKKKSGPEKKSFVINQALYGLAGLPSAMSAISTGGQKQTWDVIGREVGNIVENQLPRALAEMQ